MSARVPPLTVMTPGTGDADPRAAAAHVEALFREHYRALVTFAARYTLRRDAAEDVVQEVFLRLWERFERDGVGASATEVTRSYLFSAVRYHALPLLRRGRLARRWSEREAQVLRLDGAAPTHASDADAALDRDDLARTVRRAVAGLSDKTRVVFLLSRERGFTYAEIAEVLGISVKTVELHMTRALKALRAALRGATLGVALFAAPEVAGLVNHLAAWVELR